MGRYTKLGRFGFQLRTVVILGVLFLVVMNILVLLQLHDNRKALEVLTRREVATRLATAAESVGEAALAQAVRGPLGISPINQVQLERLGNEYQFRTVAIVKAEGVVRFSVGPLPNILEVPQLSVSALRGAERVIPGNLTRASNLGSCEAWWPIVNTDGERVGALYVIATAQTWADVDRETTIIFWTLAVALFVLAVMSVLFAQWLIRPFKSLAQVAGEAGWVDSDLDRGDPDALVDSIKRAAATLAAQQRDLERLEGHSSRLSDLIRFAEAGGQKMTSGLLVVDRELKPQALNTAASRLLGWEAGLSNSWVGKEALYEKVVHCIETGEPSSRTVLEWKSQADEVWAVGVSIAPCLDEQDRTEGALVLMTDLTEIRQIQERARLKDGLASVGELSAGIAHEVRNALGTILGYGKWLQKKGGEEVQKPASAIVLEVEALRKTLDAFLQYARPRKPEWDIVPLDPLLDELIQEFPEIEAERRGSFGEIEGDADLLRGAFRNLFVNVKLLKQRPEHRPKLLISGKVSADLVYLEFADDGPGVPLENREAIFRPFFTSRESGTGLGLAWVQRAIVEHGGDILCRESEWGGALFEIRLPLERTSA